MANFTADAFDATANEPRQPRRWYQLSLTAWIIISLFLGGLIGYISHVYDLGWGDKIYFLRDIFLNLIKSIIAPLIFSTIVVGIAGGGDMKKIGRMGVKAIIYFEIATTIALFIGLGVANLIRPGDGVRLDPGTNTGAIQTIAQTKPKNLVETIVHVFPSSVIDAMAKGDVLQIVAFSVLFAFAVAAMGEKGRPIYRACESLSQIMFKFTGYVMLFAPFGIGAAMAHTIDDQGLSILWNFIKLILGLYAALAIFVVFVLGGVALLMRIPIRQFIRAVREPATLAFVTTSSESALPKALEVMERFGVPKRIVSFVMPTGYSFNLDGTTLYLAMATVFVAQAIETTTNGAVVTTFGQQIVMMLALMITSKGVAAVPRASLVILLATISTFYPRERYGVDFGPIAVAIIFGIDEVMDMARTGVNLVGNCLATAVVARWEGEFDDHKARVFGTAEEQRMDIREGEPAFAHAAAQG